MTNVKVFSAKIRKLNSRGFGEVIDKNSLEIFEIPFSLPNEIVDFSYDSAGKVTHLNFKIVSPDRTRALCPQFKKCGGCSLQHASTSFLKEWKKSVVSQALTKSALHPKFRSTFVTPQFSRRRAVFSGRRTKKGTIVGFNSFRSNTIVSVAGCVILDQKILAFLPGMESITALGCTRSSSVKMHVSVSENGLDVFVSGGRSLDKELRLNLTKLAFKWKLARLSWDYDLIISPNPPVQMFDTIRIVPPEVFFMQATKEAEEVMVKEVCDALKDEKSVVDLFSGLGTFSLPLSKTKEVFAFEQSPQMLKALNNAWRYTPKLKAIKTQIRNLQKNPISKEGLSKIEGAVINPPRAGARAQCKQLAMSGVKTIVLVSCNPETFASDAEILSKGRYNLDWVRVIDQFRWSHHIEVIAKFSRSH